MSGYNPLLLSSVPPFLLITMEQNSFFFQKIVCSKESRVRVRVKPYSHYYYCIDNNIYIFFIVFINFCIYICI